MKVKRNNRNEIIKSIVFHKILVTYSSIYDLQMRHLIYVATLIYEIIFFTKYTVKSMTIP